MNLSQCRGYNRTIQENSQRIPYDFRVPPGLGSRICVFLASWLRREFRRKRRWWRGRGQSNRSYFHLRRRDAERCRYTNRFRRLYLATVESGQLTLSIPGGETNYSVAYMCPGTVAVTSGVASGERVILASIQDGTPVRMICAGSSSIQLGMATVQVNAAAIPGAAYAFAGPYQQQWSGGTLSFSNEMLSGTHEVAAYAVDASFNALAVRILRNQTIPGALNGGNPVLLGSGDLTVPRTITYHNVPSGFSAPLTNAQYLSAGGASVSLSQGETAQYPAIPAGEVQSGDDYAFSAGARSTTTPSEYMFVNKPPRSSGGPQTFTFPAPWSYA